jgi:hypothetical protein
MIHVYTFTNKQGVVVHVGESKNPHNRYIAYVKRKPQRLNESIGRFYNQDLELQIVSSHLTRKKAREEEDKLKEKLGIVRSETNRARNGGIAVTSILKECPHCNKISKGVGYNRWHGNNCKYNEQNLQRI